MAPTSMVRSDRSVTGRCAFAPTSPQRCSCLRRRRYDGGELIVQDTLGERSVKLRAGDLVLYPGTSIHRVAPVTRGVRLAAFFWIESMVRGNTERDVLFQLDNAIQRLANDVPEHGALVELAGVYHNLLRCWAET